MDQRKGQRTSAGVIEGESAVVMNDEDDLRPSLVLPGEDQLVARLWNPYWAFARQDIRPTCQTRRPEAVVSGASLGLSTEYTMEKE